MTLDGPILCEAVCCIDIYLQLHSSGGLTLPCRTQSVLGIRSESATFRTYQTSVPEVVSPLPRPCYVLAPLRPATPAVHSSASASGQA